MALVVCPNNKDKSHSDMHRFRRSSILDNRLYFATSRLVVNPAHFRRIRPTPVIRLGWSDEENGRDTPEKPALPAASGVVGRIRVWFLKLWSFLLFEIILLHRTSFWGGKMEQMLDALRLLRAKGDLVLICTLRGEEDAAKTQHLHDLQVEWEKFLKARISWWQFLATFQTIVFLGFILTIIQVARNNDPVTRAMSLVTSLQLFIVVGLIMLVPAHLGENAKTLHFAVHFQQLHDRKRSLYAPTEAVFLVPVAAFFWSFLPVLVTLCAAYYNTVVPNSTSSDTDVYLPRGWWITALVSMGLLLFLDALVATWVVLKLQQYSAAAEHDRPSEMAVVVAHHEPPERVALSSISSE